MGNSGDYQNAGPMDMMNSQSQMEMAMIARAYHMPPHQAPHHMYGLPLPMVHPSASEHWGAAESLTFLKRGSPASDRKQPPSRPFTLGVSPVTKASPPILGGGVIDVMPSLASSSDGTSPSEATRNKIASSSSTPDFAGKKQDNALLLAAVAMTEFGQSPPPSSGRFSSLPSSSEQTESTSNRLGSETNESPHPSKRSIDFGDSSAEKTRRSSRRRKYPV